MLKRIIFIMLFVIMPVCVASADYSGQSAQSETKEAEGRVASMDWVSSSLILKYLAGATYEEIKLYFPREAKIVKGNEEIEISDVELSDLLRVEYYTDEKEKKDVVIRAEVVE